MSLVVEVNYATEGVLDAAVAERLIANAGGVPGLRRVLGGKSKLDPAIPRYIQSSVHIPWLIIRDLDNDERCAPSLRRRFPAGENNLLCFRIAVRQIESWLLADREALAMYLKVPLSKVPVAPEALPNPKRSLVDLSRSSTSLAIRSGMVPDEGVGASEGPEFTARMREFVSDHWRPAHAAAWDLSSSLARAIACLNRLVAGQQGLPR